MSPKDEKKIETGPIMDWVMSVIGTRAFGLGVLGGIVVLILYAALY